MRPQAPRLELVTTWSPGHTGSRHPRVAKPGPHQQLSRLLAWRQQIVLDRSPPVAVDDNRRLPAQSEEDEQVAAESQHTSQRIQGLSLTQKAWRAAVAHNQVKPGATERECSAPAWTKFARVSTRLPPRVIPSTSLRSALSISHESRQSLCPVGCRFSRAKSASTRWPDRHQPARSAGTGGPRRLAGSLFRDRPSSLTRTDPLACPC